ncbi:MAG: sugar kinase [Deltaproteobacteria bacterium]|nr:MAG: sugar kinase [Deltaproteobacteria bacterium]
MNLIVVGSVGLDDVETPFGKVERALGGSAIYFSMASAFFHRPGFVGVVGTDFPAEGIRLLERHGVDLQGLEKAPGETFRWGGRYGFDLNERDTLFTHLNVFEHFRPSLPADYVNARWVFLGNIDPELQLQVLEQVSSARFVAMDTMNFWIEGKPDALRKVLGRVDALLLNDGEARQLAGVANIVTAARKITEMGPRLVVIKRGEYGALLYRDESFFYAPAFPIENVVDPTGAGDAFAGGFMGYLAQADDLSWEAVCQAVVAGSTLASFCVESFSVHRMTSLEVSAISQRAQEFRRLTHFRGLEAVRSLPG